MSSCVHCGDAVSRAGTRGPVPKYCSDQCRNRAKWKRQKAANPCPGCGDPMARPSSSSAADQRCRACRFGESEHGTATRYRHGCRCPGCREAARVGMADYAKRRRVEGRPIDFQAYRTRSAAVCGQCGASFMARTDGRVQRFCSLGCANDAQGRSESPRSAFKVSRSVRLSIFEAAGWQCQLCQALTRPDEDYNHPRYPTLDHVVPRSRGGSDDVSNLRLACRQCNVLRGSNEDWVPEVTDEPVGRLAAAV